MDEPKIKPQLKLLATYYVGECAGNIEQSALKAGYSKNYSRSQSYKLLKRDDVQAYISYLQYLKETNPCNPALHIATISEIQSFWSNVMLSNDYEIKDRLRASELLAKANGVFNNDW